VHAKSRVFGRRRGVAALACVACLLAASARAIAQDTASLQSRVDAAQAQAGALASQLEAEQSQLVSAQQQAAAASSRERQLSSLLAVGEERSRRLAAEVASSQQKLALEKQRLARARRALAQRLVDIYETGAPDAISLVLDADGFDDLITRTDYLRMIEDSDTRLAARVREVRNTVARQLAMIEELKARQDAYNARLASARDQIAAVRQRAEAEAAELAEISASREATLNELRSSISGWIEDIQAAQQVSAAEAQEQVGEYLGGPFSIPSSIVMCESGGNYGAVNPSSGAGGAYQILPSTWSLYGGSGNPQEASKAQQDQIAAQIWADSGPGAWACAG
jgi:septal ring factor EnvC (AmiA/AmiB activator)